MMNTMTNNKMNMDEIIMIAGGTGPLGSCDPVGGTGPLGFPPCKTGPLDGTGPLAKTGIW